MKQGSSKLEKAEILQMTVDHLKVLHAVSGKGLRSDLFCAFVNATAEPILPY